MRASPSDASRRAPRRKHRPGCVPSPQWRRTQLGRRWSGYESVAARWLSPGTFARPRVCRSRRSPSVLAARLARSRPTSTIPPARRRGRSRPATRGCTAAAAPSPSRATARGTGTRTARPATPADRGALDAPACARRDAVMALPLRPPALVLRLVADPRPATRGPGARATGQRRMAGRERRY
jgi:hypothetical protein